MADVQNFIGKIRQLSQEKEAIIQSLEVENQSLRSTIAYEQEARGREEAVGREALVRELETRMAQLREMERENVELKKQVKCSNTW